MKVSITTNVSPATVNDLRMNLYLASAPSVVIDSIDQAWADENIWTFYNLTASTNYIYNLFSLDADGNQLFAYTRSPNFTTYAAGDTEVKAPLDVEVGEAAGLTEGATSYTLPVDYAGWEVETVEEVGTGTMKRHVAYDYEAATPTFTLLGTDHVFITGQRYVFEFAPKVIAGSTVTASSGLWSDIIIVTSQTVLNASDIGKKIIIAATASFVDIFLPDITLCPEGKVFYFESIRGNHINATIRSTNPNNIDWLEGGRTNIYIGRSENIAIYKQDTSWRIHNAYGNFTTVGRMFWSDNDTEHNAIPADGSTLNANEYVRLWQDYVSKLPSNRVVSFADWATGNNKFKFSLTNSSGLFKVPDLRDQFMVNAGALIPGTFQPQQMLDARHHIFADDGTGTKKPTKTNFAAWSSNRQSGNQDYDICQTNVPPSLGLTSPIVDQYGNPIPVGTKLRPDAIAARLFINT